MPRARSWTDEELLAAIAVATSWRAVSRMLGLTAGGGTYSVLRRHAARLDADTDHLPGLVNGRPVARRRFADDDLRAAVTTSATFADVLRNLGYQPSGGMHRFIRGHIKRLGLDTSHFVGQGWARGRSNPHALKPRPLDELLINGSSIGGSALLRRLFAAGLMAKRCQHCGRAQWRCQPIPLELDHINGDPTDNRFDNLRVLCPNCHALTPTYCGRNKGRVAELAYAAALGAVAERHESSSLSAPT